MARTVLLIDYYPRSISRIQNLLQSYGYRIIVAHDADQGMEEFRNASPDLTLIQDLLPKGHGYEVCRQLKDSEHGHRTPVILLTAPRSGGRRHELLETRCDDFVEKPFTDDGLLAAVRKILPASEITPAIPVAAAAQAAQATQPASPLAASAPAQAAAVPIPVELTAEDIGAALDMILPGPQKKQEPVKGEAEPMKAEAVVEEPKNGKRRSLKNLLKRKRKPKADTEEGAKKKSAAKRVRKTTKKSTKKAARKKNSRAGSAKKVPAPA